MNKKNILLLLLLLVMMPVSHAYADDTAYQSQGNVGFTGTWETQTLPDTGQVAPTLPRTGERGTSSLATSGVGAVLLLLITAYGKKRRKEGIDKV